MMPHKLLIAVMSCERDVVTHDAIRETWVTQLKGQADYKFFIGTTRRYKPKPDEMMLDCGDSYEEVSDKTLAIFRYALAEGYTHVLHVGRDTYLNLDKIIAADLWHLHYAGNGSAAFGVRCFSSSEPDEHGKYNYASGGAGSWLTAHAMQTVLDSPCRHVADDLMMGWALGAAGIYLWDDDRFARRGNVLEWDQFTIHLSKGTGVYHTAFMYKAHECEVSRCSSK